MGSTFVIRMEDLDQVVSRRDLAAGQLADLAAVGIDWDGEVVFQSERIERYQAALAQLSAADLTYPCYCTRREIREAAAAPNGPALPEGAYPGTCRNRGIRARRDNAASGRPAAVRLRSDASTIGFTDALAGYVEAEVDDLVLVRNDGVYAYNLAVVVDDAAQGVDQVVRGDDLALSTPRQRYLGHLLGLPELQYAHVPLVYGPDGQRLAKRHGAVSLADLSAAGWSSSEVRDLLWSSLGSSVPWRITQVDLDLINSHRT